MHWKKTKMTIQKLAYILGFSLLQQQFANCLFLSYNLITTFANITFICEYHGIQGSKLKWNTKTLWNKTLKFRTFSKIVKKVAKAVFSNCPWPVLLNNGFTLINHQACYLFIYRLTEVLYLLLLLCIRPFVSL